MSEFKIPEEVLAKLPPAFRNLPPLQVAAKIQQYIEFETKTNRVRDYKPSPKQAQFHTLEATHRELMLGGGNRSGKTYCISMACSFHLTGEYPSWWKGRRFDKPIRMWVASRKTEFLRDVAQRALTGPPEEIGTGSIPLAKIIKVTKRAGSIPDAIDTITVRHKSGGVSRVKFKSYEEGWETFQGESVDVVWLDEEPDDFKVYTEALARIGDRRGLLMISFTPLKGRTETIVRFMEQRVAGSAFIVIGLKDTTHLTREQIEEMVAGYPKHERDARVDGEPKLGAGAVFGDIDPDLVEIAQIEVADHWYRIVGQDYGLDHPTVLAFIAHDRELDNWYLYDLHCASEMLPDAHYMVWKKKCETQGVQIPVAWPADGRQRGKGSGVALQQQYRDLGMLMLDESAKLPEFDVEGKAYSSRTSVEAQILLMHTAMRQGRFKVLKHLEPFWREFRRYFRKEDGKLTDKGDDVLAAIRYGMSMEMQGHGVQKTAPAIYLPRKTYSSRYG